MWANHNDLTVLPRWTDGLTDWGNHRRKTLFVFRLMTY